MSLENQPGGAAGTDYKQASYVKDTEAYRPAESGITDSAEQKATADTARDFAQSIFGTSELKWSSKAATEPDFIEFTAATEEASDPFSKKYNEVPDAGPAGDAEKPEKSEKGASGLTELTSQLGGFFGFGGDQEAARIIKNATRGKANLDAQDAQYIEQWRGPAMNGGEIAPPEAGDDPQRYTHKNADGSSYDVTNGKISAFTTAPTREHPGGQTFSAISYDSNNQITGYDHPSGQRHTRISTPNRDGFAQWKATTLDGKPAAYSASNASVWTGKPVVDTDGFHNLIGNGTYAGQMFSRHMDGSQTVTTPQYANGKMLGVHTSTTLKDNSTVSRSGRFAADGKLVQNDSDITVKEGDGPKTSHVEFSESGEAKIKEGPKPLEKSDKGKDIMSLFGKVLGQGGADMFKDVQELNVQRTGPGKFSINGDLKHVFMPPPNVSVGGFGPLGRVSATPNGGTLDKFSLNLSYDGNNVNASGMEGFGGTASLSRTNRRGRVQEMGRSVPTTTLGMNWDMNSNTVTARSDRSTTVLNSENFNNESFMKKLLSDEGAEQKARETLQAMDKSLKSLYVKQTAPDQFHGTLDLQENQVNLAGMPGVKTSLYMDDKIDFAKTKEGLSFKKGEIQLGIQIGNTLENRRDIASISKENVDGEQVMRIRFHDKGPELDLPISETEKKPTQAKSAPPAAQPPDRAQPAARSVPVPIPAPIQSDSCGQQDNHRRLFRRRR